MFEAWTPEEEAARLKARFRAIKAAPDMTIARFAEEHGLHGGPSLVSQHCSGTRPIGLEAAVAYARAFGVPLEEISPSRAAEVSEWAKLVGKAPLAAPRPAIPPGPAPDVHIALSTIAARLAGADQGTRELVAGMLALMAKNPENFSQVATGLRAILSSGHSDEHVEAMMPATRSLKERAKADHEGD